MSGPAFLANSASLVEQVVKYSATRDSRVSRGVLNAALMTFTRQISENKFLLVIEPRKREDLDYLSGSSFTSESSQSLS